MPNKFKTLVAISFCLGLFGCTKSKISGPPKENIFRYAIEAKVPSLDPTATTDVYSAQAQQLVYETLYDFHYLKRPLQVIPVLAEALPEVSKDKRRMTIKIKKGILFQDDPCFEATQGKGREVNADDVVYMFHRAAAPKSISSAYGLFEDNILGINDYHTGKTPSIAGVKALDPYTVQIDFAKILPRFIFAFTDIKTAILPKECIEKYGDKLARHPVGTGPFHFEKTDLESKLVAVKNPNYHTLTYPTEGNPGDRENGLLEDAGKALPLVDKVVFEVIQEKQPAWLKFLSGDFEVTGIPKDYIPSVIPNDKLADEYVKMGIKHFRSVKGDVTVQVFNMLDPVWGKHKELRHAFALALDVPKVLALQYSSQAIQAQSIIDPTQYGYDPKYKSKWSDRNIKKAKELLAKAGFPGGKGLPPIIAPSLSDTTARQFDELLTRQLAEVGIVVKSEYMTWPEMMARKQRKDFTVFGVGYASTVPDVDDATGLTVTKSIAVGQNPASYSNPEVDKLVKEIEVMENGPARLAKIRRWQEILDDDLPIVSMAHRIGNQLVQPWLKNHVFTDNGVFGSFIKYQKTDTTYGSKK